MNLLRLILQIHYEGNNYVMLQKTFRGFGSFNGLVMGITHTSLKADTDVNEYNQR